ncbi:DUF397 domain-containing protein [Actinacidiphila yeochonensis]|uniref:DUF397 domain-containing protein n=1 Tax=Actinacidiphila yeochonensis TaxID=89050 RepID=UPI00056868EC|nr:DUF397 domain-containing protein [Actinacidiphila yeochonensis]
MTNPPNNEPEWRKSSYSGGAGNDCVEVAAGASDRTLVRDSKDPEGPRLCFSANAFAEFVDAVARDRFRTL